MKGPTQPENRRRHKVTAVGGLLNEVLAPAAARQGLLLAQLLPYWPSICPLLADHAVPESVRAGTLTVAASTSSVQRELQFLAPSIVEGVNTILGYAAVGNLKAVVRGEAAQPLKAPKLTKPLPPAPAQADKASKACESIADEDLRKALVKFGSLVLKG